MRIKVRWAYDSDVRREQFAALSRELESTKKTRPREMEKFALFCGIIQKNFTEAVIMSQFEFVSCRLAIQICTGHFPDGRERHRTFSVKDIKPDADNAPGRETKPRVSTNSVFAEPTKLTKTAADVCLFFRTFLAAFRAKKGCNLWPIQTTLSMEYGGKQ
jgi:hypothetical protein